VIHAMLVTSATLEAEIGGSWFEANPGKNVSEMLCQKNKPGVVVSCL
jgi:hypothetical protein